MGPRRAKLETAVFNRPSDRSDRHSSLRSQKFCCQPRMEISHLNNEHCQVGIQRSWDGQRHSHVGEKCCREGELFAWPSLGDASPAVLSL